MRFLRFYGNGGGFQRNGMSVDRFGDPLTDPIDRYGERLLKSLYRLTLIKDKMKVPVALEKIYESGYRIVYWTGRPCEFGNRERDHGDYWREWLSKPAGFYYVAHGTEKPIDPANPDELASVLRTFLEEVQGAARKRRPIRDFVQEYPALRQSLPEEQR